MTRWHLVDKELIPLLEAMPAFDPDAMPLADLRAQREAVAPPLPTERDGIEFSEQWIAREGSQERLRVLIYRPRHLSGPLPAFLHIHGGGYILGRADYSDAKNEMLAKTAGCLIVSVDYRLAPETPFPGAIEDCLLALEWLAANHATLGIDPARIAIGGESAGGGLAAALALLARDRSTVKPIFQWLIYPMIDDRTGAGAESHPFAGQHVWTPRANRFGWQSLLGKPPGGDDVPAYAAAARAEDLSRLPPAYVAVGALDLFIDEDLEYGRRLARAGVPVEMRLYPGAFHGFDVIGRSALGDRFTADSVDALRRALN